MSDSLRRRLDPEVLALYERGKLHEFDVGWIVNLPKDRQLASARKCIEGGLHTLTEGRMYKGRGSCFL